MRLMPKVAVLALASLVALAGCRMKPKLHDERTLTLEPGVMKPLEVPAINVEQTVNVSFDSGSTPVSVYLALDKDVRTATDDDKIVAAAKAKAEKQTSGTVSVLVPANEQLNVYVKTDSKDATVKVKIAN